MNRLPGRWHRRQERYIVEGLTSNYLDNLTPIEAINLLNEIKNQIDKK